MSVGESEHPEQDPEQAEDEPKATGEQQEESRGQDEEAKEKEEEPDASREADDSDGDEETDTRRQSDGGNDGDDDDDEPSSDREPSGGRIRFIERDLYDIKGSNEVRNYHYYGTFNALRKSTSYNAKLDEVSRDLKRIVDPPDARAHFRALEEQRILVLAGPSKSGLSTGARYRWKEFASDNGLTASELFSETREELLGAVDDIETRTVLLLDVSHNEEFAPAVVGTLGQLQKALRANDGYLLIALNRGVEREAGEELPEAVFAIGRPDPREVLRIHVESDIDPAPLLAAEGLPRRLDSLWPPQARRLADLLNTAGAGYDVRDVLRKIDLELKDHSESLGRLFATATEPEQRTLLIAAAALEGAERSMLALAAEGLFDHSGFDGERPQLLEQPHTLSHRLGDLHEVLSAEHEDPAFIEPGYGQALLDYVWREFPRWRQALRTWFDWLLLNSPDLGDRATATLAVRLLALASHTNEDTMVAMRARNLVMHKEARLSHRLLAARLLVAAANDSVIGQSTRYWLGAWAGSASRPLQRAALDTCTDPAYYERFPRSALTRLSHLLRSNDEGIRPSAAESIREIVKLIRPGDLIDDLTRILNPVRSPDFLGRAAELVIDMFDEEWLLEQFWEWPGIFPVGSDDRLRRFWHRLLEVSTTAQIKAAVNAWVHLASQLPIGLGHEMADHLGKAATSDFRTLGKLAQAIGTRASSGPGSATGHRRAQLIQRIRRNLLQTEVS